MKPLVPTVVTCVYCGYPTRYGRACRACSPMLENDPYYSQAIHSSPLTTIAPQAPQLREAPCPPSE